MGKRAIVDRSPLDRRSILLGICSLASMAVLRPRRDRSRPIAVRLWVTERAATYEGVGDCATELLSHALEAVGLDAELTADRTPVELPGEDADRSRRVTWPRMVIEGASGVGPVRPVADVNLLVTDGDVTGEAAGYALPHIAAVAGARHLVELPPADRVAPVVAYSIPAVIGQLLLHECGHALGLDHDHGSITADETTATVSPMIGGYAWATKSVRRRHLGGEVNACGQSLPQVPARRRRLSLRFSDCATEAIRRHHRRRLGTPPISSTEAATRR